MVLVVCYTKHPQVFFCELNAELYYYRLQLDKATSKANNRLQSVKNNDHFCNSGQSLISNSEIRNCALLERNSMFHYYISYDLTEPEAQ